MPKIVFERYFDGAKNKIARLGLTRIVEELREIVSGFRLEVEETKDANGGAPIRTMIDERFAQSGDWVKKAVGGIDHTKCSEVGGVRLCVGAEIQVSGRSDLVAVDLLHLKQALRGGEIDVGVLVVPSDKLSSYLVSRCPSVKETLRIFENFEAESLPLVLWGIEHDGPGKALPVKGRKSRTRRRPSR